MDHLWEAIIALITLTSLEIVLGIDNIIFIAILSDRLKGKEQKQARFLGLLGAMIIRILLLLAIKWVMSLDKPWLEFGVLGADVSLSWKDIILIVGGLFLIGKSTHEVHDKLEGPEEDEDSKPAPSMWAVVGMIVAMDVIFSLDSVITAVGMTDLLWVMITAIVISIGVMMVFANTIGDFVERHPTIKMLALSFLLLIGVMLVSDGFGFHIPKGYIYFAMAFSLGVEILNMRLRKVSQPRKLRRSSMPR